MNRSDDHPEQSASPAALRVLAVLQSAHADSPDTAIVDPEIGKRARVATRKVVVLSRELAEKQGIAVLASCGENRSGRRGKGRYIEKDPMKIRAYGEGLHRRAGNIHDRAWVYLRLADRKESERPVEANGQMRMAFA